MPDDPVTTPYELLHVHPAAPGELLNTSYWLRAGELQRRREAGENVDAQLHELTAAYQHVAEPAARAAYDAANGVATADLTTMALPRRRKSLPLRLLRPGGARQIFDFYAVLGVTPDASPRLIDEAYHIMRDRYMRLSVRKGRRDAFLLLLEDAREVVQDSEKRARYDASLAGPAGAVAKKARPARAAAEAKSRKESQRSKPEKAETKSVASTSPVSKVDPKAKRSAESGAAATPAKLTAAPKVPDAKPAKSPKVRPGPAAASAANGATPSSAAPSGPARWIGSLRPPKAPDEARKVDSAGQKGKSAASRKVALPTPKAARLQPKVAASAEALEKPPLPARPRSSSHASRPLDKVEVEEALLGRIANTVRDQSRAVKNEKGTVAPASVSDESPARVPPPD